jgi:hypothetical protein
MFTITIIDGIYPSVITVENIDEMIPLVKFSREFFFGALSRL